MIFPESFVSLADINADFLKKFYLIGFTFVDDKGMPLPDDFYDFWLAQGAIRLERELGITVLPRTFTKETHDYYAVEYLQYAFFRTHHWPVREVLSVGVFYQPDKPIVVYPNEWVRLEKGSGQIRLIPTISQQFPLTFLTGQGWGPLLLSLNSEGFPQYWHISYTAGWNGNEVPYDIVNAIAELALLLIVQLAGITMVPIGITSESASIDGISQSRSYGQPFAWIIQAWKQDLYGDPKNPNDMGSLALLRQQYKGILVDAL